MIMIDAHWNKSVGGLYLPGGTQGNWCLSLSCDVQNGDALTMHWPCMGSMEILGPINLAVLAIEGGLLTLTGPNTCYGESDFGAH